jgi:hypothetical protein
MTSYTEGLRVFGICLNPQSDRRRVYGAIDLTGLANDFPDEGLLDRYRHR